MVSMISSSVSPVQTITISVRWTITSSATVSLKSKTFSIISFSSASMAPFSSLMSISARSCSSDTDSRPASGRMRVMRRKALQAASSPRRKGLTAAASRAPAKNRAAPQSMNGHTGSGMEDSPLKQSFQPEFLRKKLQHIHDTILWPEMQIFSRKSSKAPSVMI